MSADRVSKNLWFPLYYNDYFNDTADLTHAQHGAYLQCMGVYYKTEKPLPGDLRALYRMTNAFTEEEQANVRLVVERFFTLEDGAYHQKRIEAELAIRAEKRGKRQHAANTRWSKTPEEALEVLHQDNQDNDDLPPMIPAGTDGQPPLAAIEELVGPQAMSITKQLIVHIYGDMFPWTRAKEGEFFSTHVMLEEGFSELSIVNASLLRVNKTVDLDCRVTTHGTREEALAEGERITQQVKERIAAKSRNASAGPA
jgi:uncharacterized protein YdaU (DUF1376 family)